MSDERVSCVCVCIKESDSFEHTWDIAYKWKDISFEMKIMQLNLIEKQLKYEKLFVMLEKIFSYVEHKQ